MKGKGKLILSVVAMMLALLVLYACGNESPTATPTVVSGGNTPVVGENTPVESTPEANNTPGATEPTPGNGSTANMGDWTVTPTSGTAGKMKMTVNSVRTERSGIVDPQSGMEYLILNLTFDNGTQDPQTISSLMLFSLKDAAGKEYTIALGARVNPQIEGAVGSGGSGTSGDTGTGTAPPGGTLTGEIGYEIPQDAKSLILTFKPILQDENVTVKLER